jgi:hypothetical protein
MVTLKTQDVSDEEFPVLSGHPHEASVEAIHTAKERQWIHSQDLDRGLKVTVIGEEKRQGQDVTEFIICGDHHADTSGAEVDGRLG